jgi:hypothetical protein
MLISEITSLSKELEAFIPKEASVQIAEKLVCQNVKLTITKKRQTKLGDYRAPNTRIGYHRISINGDLNSYMFLLVLLHEFAHLQVWELFKNNVKAHGVEWKEEYRKLYDTFSIYFPEDIKSLLLQHFENVKATTCNDPFLTKHLMHMGETESILLMSDLNPGDQFETNGRQFEMINKRRTRFLCKDLSNKRQYLVSGTALVTRLNK